MYGCVTALKEKMEIGGKNDEKETHPACVDMCWAWIINPVGAKDFLKKYLVTAPANKILTFGGDYIPVEPELYE